MSVYFSIKKINFLITIIGLVFVVTLSVGIDSCAESKEYCKYYKSMRDQSDCTSYCATNKDFAASTKREHLVKSCELGQIGYLRDIRIPAAQVMLACDRKFDDRDQAAACRIGAMAEELRISKSCAGVGSSNDRETGNNR